MCAGMLSGFRCVPMTVSSPLWPYELCLTRLLCPQDSPGKNTGVGCHALLQGTFPTQGSSSGLHIKNYLRRKQNKCTNQKTQPGLADEDTRVCVHFHRARHSAWPLNCMRPFYIARVIKIKFPLYLATVIYPIFCTDFIFLSGNWWWKLINIFYYCDDVTITHLISLYHDWSTEKS